MVSMVWRRVRTHGIDAEGAVQHCKSAIALSQPQASLILNPTPSRDDATHPMHGEAKERHVMTYRPGSCSLPGELQCVRINGDSGSGSGSDSNSGHRRRDR